MKESELNSIVKKNFERFGGWAHKIQDPQFHAADGTRFNLSRPFDGIALYDDGVYAWESKMQHDYNAFSFARIQDHQIENLQAVVLRKPSDSWAFIVLGINIPRKSTELYIFDIDLIIRMKRLNFKSISKYHLEKLKNNGDFITVKKGQFDISQIRKKCVYSFWKEDYGDDIQAPAV